MKKILTAILLMLVLGLPALAANYNRYFTVAGAGAMNGLSWADAWAGADLQEKMYTDAGLSGSAGSTCILNVAAGTYTAVPDDGGVTPWKGAFKAQAYQILMGTNAPDGSRPTIIKGVAPLDSDHAVIILGTEQSGAWYVTVTGGNNTLYGPLKRGGGIDANPPVASLSCSIVGCIVISNFSGTVGAGIYANATKVLNTTIAYNRLNSGSSTIGGGGIYLSEYGAYASNCLITCNTFETSIGGSPRGGAGVCGLESYGNYVYDSVISFNTNSHTVAQARNGGGATTVNLVRCLVLSNTVQNSSAYGGGSSKCYSYDTVYDGNSSSGTFSAIYYSMGTINCTIVNNKKLGISAAGPCANGSSSSTTLFANNIFWNNDTNGIAASPANTQSSNYFFNPKFIPTNNLVLPTIKDKYKIARSSMCYNKGDGTAVASPNLLDIFMRNRVYDGVVDIGAVEWTNDGDNNRKREMMMMFNEYIVKE